ncbi:acyl-CoA dehydrogenase family protein [Psychrobacillus sp. FSL K6-2684]|uniref:acyl-CoA dehydrogenase family protein n=1 Tax=unclassified Psychrobacillus TaxID=2636677 RepID=UPI001246EA32|nr:acyl-CoA dehydrogenase family protein [Psychrobacillus sp. AK 1817]QEY19692.1 acyl-CoA dehydrogenase family protein [Psychrobacillus sp. AK 1817]
MDQFIKTEQQYELLSIINDLKPVFRHREPDLDNLGSFPFADFQDLKNINYHTLTLPEKYGGQGFGLYEYILAQEAISEGSGSTGLSIGWHNGIILEYAENNHWNRETAEWLLGEIGKGAIINSAATEKNAGSPTRGALPRTTVVRDKKELIINGEKTFTSASPVLNYILVTCTNEVGIIEMIVIPKDSPGVTIEETWDMLAMRGTASHTLILENVRAPERNILKTLPATRPEAKGWMLHIPACYIGIAAAARNYAVEFAATYTPSSLGKPIAETPNIKQIIGEMELELSIARHMLYGTAERYEQAEDKTTLQESLDITKIAVTNGAIKIVDLAMKIVGSRALSQSNPMHRYYMNVRAGLYNPPMEDMIKAKLASASINAFQID